MLPIKQQDKIFRSQLTIIFYHRCLTIQPAVKRNLKILEEIKIVNCQRRGSINSRVHLG